MTILLEEAKRIFLAPKRLLSIHEWQMKPKRGGSEMISAFESRIEIAGALPRGIWFRAIVRPKYLDSATFQLECEMPGTRSHLPLYRLDWRPLSIHVNGMFGPEELRGLMFDVGQSHEHVCFDHAVLQEGRLRSGGVQTATKIDPDFEDYRAALAYVCDKLKIANGDEIPVVRDLGGLF